MANTYYVYALFRPDGRPCYIGKGKRGRWLDHERMVKTGKKHSNPYLGRIIAQAGGNIPRIKIAEGLTEQEAFEIEKAFIAALGRVACGGILVNLTDGGDGVSGHKHSEEYLAKIRGRKLSAEHRAKLAAAKAHVSPETREKMRLAKLGTKQSPETVAKRTGGLAGRKRDPAICAKITAGKLGKKATEETKAALRAANRSRDPEVRERISLATRAAMARLKEQKKKVNQNEVR